MTLRLGLSKPPCDNDPNVSVIKNISKCNIFFFCISSDFFRSVFKMVDADNKSIIK